jgi:hypothetical protein
MTLWYLIVSIAKSDRATDGFLLALNSIALHDRRFLLQTTDDPERLKAELQKTADRIDIDKIQRDCFFSIMRKKRGFVCENPDVVEELAALG